jgi:hypothetical protein
LFSIAIRIIPATTASAALLPFLFPAFLATDLSSAVKHLRLLQFDLKRIINISLTLRAFADRIKAFRTKQFVFSGVATG